MPFNSLFLMSNGLSQTLQLLAGLSLLIVLHEFGHFFFARLFGTRVEKFYLFFDFLFPFSGMLNFSLFKKKKGDTEYGIGWFPLGGYVKIAGMVDESMDKEALAQPPQPWEYRSKKAWQRLLIMLGGIIMNVLVAIVLYVIIYGVWGDTYTPVTKATSGVVVDSVGYWIGFRDGDMIKSVDGKTIKKLEEIPLALILHDKDATINVVRNGKDTTFPIPLGTISRLIKIKSVPVSVRTHAIIDTVLPKSIGDGLGLQKGDSIISVNNQQINYSNEFVAYKSSHYDTPLEITYARAGKLNTVHTSVPKDSAIGIVLGESKKYSEHITYTPFTAIGKGTQVMMNKLRIYIVQFKLLGSPEVKVSQSMGGFGSMAKMYTPEFHWIDFLSLTAFISVALAIMNLLPIPGLDGGYVIFLLFEMITGKKVSEKVMERATTVGLVILLALMLYVNGLDVLKAFKK